MRTGCSREDRLSSAECLRGLPAEAFLPDFEKPCTLIPPHMPTVDGAFIPGDPELLLKSRLYNKDIDVMLGTMTNEGYLVGSMIIPHSTGAEMSVGKVEDHILQDITGLYPEYPTYIREALAKKAVESYVMDTSADALTKSVTEYIGDSMLLWPTYLCGILLSGRQIHKYFCKHVLIAVIISSTNFPQRAWRGTLFSTSRDTVRPYRRVQPSSEQTTATTWP